MDLTAHLTAALADRYDIQREVGAGGMAHVFLARDLRHERLVAIKVLNAQLGAMVGAERFFAEIKVTAALQHPHLLPLFDSGEADGQLYYVMPYMEGETLRERMNRETMLPVDDAIRITQAVASALDYAHRHGVVHRDLKPENILLHDGEPMLADFGIALALANAGGERMTQTGMSLGTPQYMSPEQATGDRQIDARTDVYSLAAVLYEMLTGDPPHTGHNAQAVIAKVITERPRGMRDTREAVPPHVEAAVLRALAKLPADRFASAAEFGAAIAKREAAPSTVSDVRTTNGRRAAATGVSALTAARRWAIPVVALAGAALVGSALAAGSATRDPVQPLRFDIHWTHTRSTPSASAAGNLALSPDGTRLARTPLGGAGGIYTRPMDGLAWSLVPGTDSVRATAPTFSPTGEVMLYVKQGPNSFSPLDYLLMRIPVDGGESVQLADSVYGDAVSWGDKDRVVFVRDGALWTVSALGDEPSLLAEPDSTRNHAGFRTVAYLPGGDAILVTIAHGKRIMRNERPNDLDSAYLGVVRVSDGTVTDFGVRGLGPKYSLGHLLYTEATGTVIALPFDAKALKIVGAPTRLAEGALVGATSNDLVVSENGWVLYTPNTLGTRNTAAMPQLGLERVSRATGARSMNVQPQTYVSMSVSPDGERIALCVATSTSSADIWILQVATGHLSPLTRDGKNCWPVWTRDGKRVAYRTGSSLLSQVEPGNWFSVPWDLSTLPEPVPGTEGAIAYEPGPPGGYFATVRLDSAPRGGNRGFFSNGDIWISPVDTPQVRRPLSATAAGEWAPRLSPNGKWLAFMVYEPVASGRGTSPAKIYVRPVPGPGALIPISTGPGQDPFWGRDESTLHFRGVALARGSGGRAGAGRVAARLDLSRGAPVLRIDQAFPGTAPGAFTTWGVSGLLPGGDLVQIARAQAAGPATPPVRPPVQRPPNPVAIFGWLDLVKGNAQAQSSKP
ncbi:MAG: protein kinase [Gemmatimonadota bacterium]|nr:protein kinase [Gemmatimonadota bacterium]